MNGVHGIIFAHQWHTGLKELTEQRVPASVPFCGRYRFIDFMLSNMVNAGITDVGVILSGNYQSLLDHLGSGKDWNLSRLHGGLKLLPPFGLYQNRAVTDFRGKMDALDNVYSYLEKIRQDYVLLADSDVIINLDLREVYEDHIRSGADVTVVCVDNKDHVEDATYFTLDKDNNIIETIFGVRDPKGVRSLEIFLLSKSLLLQSVEDAMIHDRYSFRISVLQNKQLKRRAFLWEGAASQIRTLNEYYDRSMELLDPAKRQQLFPVERPIYTKERNNSSTYLDPEGGCVNSIVADGCTVEGTVENSILFRGVTVGKGAVVRNCILMQDVVVGRGSDLNHIIADKGVHIGEEITLAATASCPMAIAKGKVI